MFLAFAEIHYKGGRTPRNPQLDQNHPSLVLHPILHPFQIVRFLSYLSFSTQILPGAYFSLLPTPSPELLHSPAHPLSHHPSEAHEIYLQNQPTWEATRPEPLVGSKRSHDYAVDDFFTDMKKRRVNPSYDPREYSAPPFYSLCISLIIFFMIRYGRASQ
jgi:hypothetical protein